MKKASVPTTFKSVMSAYASAGTDGNQQTRRDSGRRFGWVERVTIIKRYIGSRRGLKSGNTAEEFPKQATSACLVKM